MTLLEMVIAAALLAVVGVGLNGIFVNQSGLLKTETATIEAGLSLNQTFQQIDQSVRNTSGISNSSNAQNLILAEVSFSFDSNLGLLRQQNSTINTVLAKEVKSLEFVYLDKSGQAVSPDVAASVTTHITIGTTTNPKTASKTTYLRNTGL